MPGGDAEKQTAPTGVIPGRLSANIVFMPGYASALRSRNPVPRHRAGSGNVSSSHQSRPFRKGWQTAGPALP